MKTTIHPLDAFTANPNPTNAVALAIADAIAVKPTHWEYVDELQRAQAKCKQFSALVNALREGYTVLADIKNDWPGREMMQGQSVLCHMRDALATATGQSAETVSSGVCSHIVRTALADTERRQ